MTKTTRFTFEQFAALLGHCVDDTIVTNFFGHDISNIHRDEHYGSLEFKPEGVEVVFKEAPWMMPSKKITNPNMLCVAAFHLHSEGHDGFAGYSGQLPNHVALGDSETELLLKMGEPIGKGGGGTSAVLKGPVPRWFSFVIGNLILHIQLDTRGRIDMATLQMPEISKALHTT